MSKLIFCSKLKTEEEALDIAPYPGPLGERIYQQISKPAWQLWIQHQTMLINEYRLSTLDPEARQFIETEMEKFLFGDGSATPPGFTPGDSPVMPTE